MPTDVDFFALGGNSLHATQVVARINEATGLTVQIRSLFEAPTVRALAAEVEDKLAARQDQAQRSAVERVSRDAPLALSFSQRRMWFVQTAEPDASAYNVVSGLRLRGSLDVNLLDRALNVLVRRHETLRTSIGSGSDGPVQIVAPEGTIELPRHRHQPSRARDGWRVSCEGRPASLPHGLSI